MKAQQKSNFRENIWRLSHCLATLLLMIWLPAAIQAAPGDLDPSFGNGGIVISPFTPLSDKITSIQVQPDGKIIVSGYSYDRDFDGDEVAVSGFIARYNSSGTLDASFGSNGKIIIGNYYEYVGGKTILQPDGKIVSIGQRVTLNSAGTLIVATDFTVFRYNANGTPDDSFGTGGKVFTSIQPHNYAYDVVLQPDGKIVLMGDVYDSTKQGGKFGIVRYNADGSLDNSFGTGGKVVTDTFFSWMLLRPDGKIVLGGGLGLVRYNPDGSLDSGFGTNGKVIRELPSSGIHSVLQPDGKIVVTNYGNEITRFNENGSVDTSFADNGIFRTESVYFVNNPNSIALQPDGKIIAFGSARIGASGSGFAALRLNPNGSPDTSFGTNGRLITPVGTKGVSYGLAVALQPDGKILGGGVTDASDGISDAAIVRYLGDSASGNAIDDAQFFIRQHYRDFLNREPEPGGFQGWQDILNNCAPGDSRCDRIEVSAAFFRSPEFQDRGYFTYRFYSTLARVPHYNEFMPDLAKVTGFLTPEQLEANKAAFVNEFMNRPEFQSKYGGLADPTAFVDGLLQSVGLPNHPARGVWIAGLTNGQMTRAQLLRGLVESAEVYAKFYNEAFVVMQYFGYLRRDPDILYLDWIQTMNQNGGDYRVMINGFVNSNEYRQRFRP
ncbi:MAG: DUF4214 domain-containing protein [Acidobacteriota bacterium]|nr:DUF4214 domain-containing protein [Acidobacteriota bacterium]